MVLWISLLGVLSFVATHLLVGQLKLSPKSHQRFVSAAAGVSLAYVFGHLFPELPTLERELEAGEPAWIGTTFRYQVYFVTLLGLLFYWWTRVSTRTYLKQAGPEADPLATFSGWLHFSTYASYCFLIGYHMVHWGKKGVAELSLITVGMCMHFLASDHGLHHHYHRAYQRTLRWWFAGSTLAGWVAATSYDLPERLVACLFAFTGGGIIINSIRHELPDDDDINFGSLLVGAGIYIALLFAVIHWPATA